ncbi:neurogenic locus notch homolog protein 1-like [Dreissena polymorpha]|uniref:neurogenic locus notch homolog protein 1-like n=1 Tax=Dreissena polymorpha TaxID=45954 RepID=UPI002264A9D3|nr:neurogenic locus notch homolog protein 1-like [Dreissena polymorpha]
MATRKTRRTSDRRRRRVIIVVAVTVTCVLIVGVIVGAVIALTRVGDIDECDSSPCTLGGICKDLVNNYTCTCRPVTTGRNCDITVRGFKITSDIGIDNVQLAENCPNPFSCNRYEGNCGWNKTQMNNLVSWQYVESTLTDEARGIRIRGGPRSYSGLVELFYQGRWYRVCDKGDKDDKGWGKNAATVACRWLGISIPSASYNRQCCEMERESLSFILANLMCTSTENTLYNCSHDGLLNALGCSSNDYLFVTCYGTKNELLLNTNQPHFYLRTISYWGIPFT